MAIQVKIKSVQVFTFDDGRIQHLSDNHHTCF